MPEAPDLEGLRDFSTETARDSGRFFVGREAALGRVADAAAGWRRAVNAGQSPFGVVLISGAPGAGKTAILRRVLENPPKSTAALSMPLLRLSTEASLAGSLRNALAGPADKAVTSMRPSGVAANLGLAKFTWERPSTPPATLSELDEGLSVGRGVDAVVLLIDEVQNATPDQARMLAALHQGATGLPLVPVLAGLSDAGDVLARGGISRRAVEYDIRLGRLDEGEPAEAVRMMLDTFRVQGPDGVRDRWARNIEAASDRWPAHLKTALTALARELLRADGDLALADWSRIKRDAAALRVAGYMAGVSLEMENAAPLLAQLLRWTADQPVRRVHAIAELRRLMDKNPVRDMEPEEFLDHLIHQGVLHDPNGDRQYLCPIPSFRDFLIRRGSSLAAAREDTDLHGL